jgi:hypothetical protein
MSKIITALALTFAVTAMGCSRSDNEAERERADALSKLELHRPDDSQADKNKELNELPNRIIVNVVSEAKKHDVDSGLPRFFGPVVMREPLPCHSFRCLAA